MSARRLSPKVPLSSVLLLAGCIGGFENDLQVDAGDNGSELETAHVATEGTDTSAVIFGPTNLPDLIVTTISDPPSSAAIGQSFSASETVANQGIADAGATFTKYYLSANGTTPHYFLGNRSVSAIAVNGTDSGTASLTVPTGVAQGSYRLLACADSGPGKGGRTSEVVESNENNNCTASAGSVAIGGSDLTEANVSAAFNAATGALAVSDTVNNVGTQTAGASITRWILSTDTVRDANDGYVRNCTNGGTTPGRNVGSISAGGSSAGTATASPLCVRDTAGLHPPASGAYYVFACADSTSLVGELSESNNCAVSSNTVQIFFGPDLVETSVSDPPATGVVGTTFSITDTVQNIGAGSAPSSYTKFYLSTDGTFLNAYLNTRSVGALGVSATESAATTMTILSGTPSGTYYVVACADSGPGTGGRTSQIVESNENNNCVSSMGTITIGSPDLVISTISDPPSTGTRGSSFAVTDTTTNTGAGDAGAFFNKYYLSTNGITPLYLLAKGVPAGPLAAGASQMVSTTVTIPTYTAVGTYWLLGCADAGPGLSGRMSQIPESNENNNCTRSATQITVQ